MPLVPADVLLMMLPVIVPLSRLVCTFFGEFWFIIGLDDDTCNGTFVYAVTYFVKFGLNMGFGLHQPLA